MILPMLSFAQTFDFTNAVDNWDAVTTGATLVPNATYVAVDLTDGVNNPKFGTTTAGADGVANKICAVTLQNVSATGPTYLRVSILQKRQEEEFISNKIFQQAILDTKHTILI